MVITFWVEDKSMAHSSKCEDHNTCDTDCSYLSLVKYTANTLLEPDSPHHTKADHTSTVTTLLAAVVATSWTNGCHAHFPYISYMRKECCACFVLCFLYTCMVVRAQEKCVTLYVMCRLYVVAIVTRNG